MDINKTTGLFRRLIFALAGLISTAIAIVAAWIPGLPSTVFILLALWLFSNSSNRLRGWLLRVPVLRTATAEALRFQTDGTIDLRVKIISQACAWASFVLVSLLLQSLWISIIVGLLAASCSVFMATRPTVKSKADVAWSPTNVEH